MKNKFDRGIDDLVIDLGNIAQMTETVKTPGWIEVIEIFNRVIGENYKYVFENSGKITKFIQVLCAKKVTDALGKILVSLDSRVESATFIRDEIAKKRKQEQDYRDRQALSQP